jgi:DNA repair protein RecN (Recombination protein N)
MLIGLGIRDLVLIESLDLSFGPGLTALTGETGAGKSIILDALGLALGARGDQGLVRRGASQASATAIFAPGPDHAAWGCLDEKGLDYGRDEDLVLRRVVSADGRSRAFVNDQPTGVGVLRELGALLIEIHGQHQAVGLLDARTHRALLDTFGGCDRELSGSYEAWSAWRAARERLDVLRAAQSRAVDEAEELGQRLSELDRLAPRPGEEAALAEERAVLATAERALADIAAAREQLSDDGVVNRLAQAHRALERANERLGRAGLYETTRASSRVTAAAAAVERALSEAVEAASAIDAAAEAFTVEPERLERTEERLFALRATARKLGVGVDALPAKRIELAERLQAIETADETMSAAEAEASRGRTAYLAAAEALGASRRAAGDRLAKAMKTELTPLKLDKARFQVAIQPLPEERLGPAGADRVEFEISTVPGAPFAGLGSVASGGELARLALALKVALARRGSGPQPLLIFDEVDQGVGGAVADAVGQRLARLASQAQVVVITHSPQVAARASAHWRVSKAGQGERMRTAVEVLSDAAREEEIARMLSGASVTDAARAAARALMHA